MALTERFDLVPAEFLVIPTDGHIVGDSLGPPPSRSPRDEHRRSNEFDRGYLQQQQRTRYDLDITNFHHSNFPERNPSPPEHSSSESSLGGIGESPSPSTRTRVGRTRTGTMVFAEAEANTVTDEIAARSLREREQEPQKIELLERDKELAPLKTLISATTVNEEEDVQFDMSLSPETGKSGEEGNNSVASEVSEEIPELMEKDELPSLLDLKLESEEAVNTAEIAVLPSAPVEPEAKVPTLHSSTEEEPAEPTVSLPEVKSGDDSLETQPILIETTTAYPPVSSIEVKSDDSSETQPILVETTTAYLPPVNDNVSLSEPTLIPKETPETAVASQPEEVATKPDATHDKEIISPSVIDHSELPTIVTSVDEMPTDQTQPEATVEVGEVVTGEKGKA